MKTAAKRLDPDKWASKKKWAERFEVSTKTVERWMAEGLKSEMLGGRIRIHEDWMEEFRNTHAKSAS